MNAPEQSAIDRPVPGRTTSRAATTIRAGTFGDVGGTLVQRFSAGHGTIVEPVQPARDVEVAFQPDPYFALPSLYGAPAYSRPPRPVKVGERPLDADDLPLATLQTDEERRVADALLASRGIASMAAAIGTELVGGGDAGYRASGEAGPAGEPGLLPRRLNLRGLTERIRPHR